MNPVQVYRSFTSAFICQWLPWDRGRLARIDAVTLKILAQYLLHSRATGLCLIENAGGRPAIPGDGLKLLPELLVRRHCRR